MVPTPRRVLVLGLDGGSFSVLRPLAEQGRLPHLARWMAEGTAAPLLSTIPWMSFPAWSSFVTGLGPGRHGIFDFTQRHPGDYRLRFVNASDRAGASLFARVSRAGGTVLALGVPATYPPEPVTGLLVPGFDAPVSSGSEAAAASDPALYREIEDRVGPWMEADLDEGAHGAGWHERALETLLARIQRKTAFAVEALRRVRERHGRGPELATVIFSESDTVAHHFWRDHDPGSPRHDPRAPAIRREAVGRVYQQLDAALGEIRAAFGEDAPCVVMSDHGVGGASHRVLHLNRYLAGAGLLQPRVRAGRLGLDSLARRARDQVLRWLSPGQAQALFRRARSSAARVESLVRFGGNRWPETVAFSEEANTQPGVWINLRGRERRGAVDPADYERVRDDVIEALLEWRLPGGGRAIARARRREEVYNGPFVDRAPDVVVELGEEKGYVHSLVPTPWSEDGGSPVRTLEGEALAGGRGQGMNGTHRREGILIATGGSELGLADGAAASIVDLAPTLLRALGIEAEDSLDGVDLQPPPVAYTPEQEERVASRLRALGYLE